MSTAHGVQGDTVTSAHLVVGEHTGAASAYVGMTRGREANTAHLIAEDLADARDQWIAVFSRDRADLGPAHAAELAAREAARYAEPRTLEQVLADLYAAWTVEEQCQVRLEWDGPVRDRLRQLVALDWDAYKRMEPVKDRQRKTWQAVAHAEQQLDASELIVGGDTDQLRDQLLDAWAQQREPARQAGRVVLDGPGLLGLRRAAVARAGAELAAWGETWRPYVPTLPADTRALAEHAEGFDDHRSVWQAFAAAARRGAEQAHPEHATLQTAAAIARDTHQQAIRAVEEARLEQTAMIGRFGGIALTHDPAGQLTALDAQATADRTELATAQARIGQLLAEPALFAQPPDRLARERDTWQARRDDGRHQWQSEHLQATEESVYRRRRHEEHHRRSTGRPGRGIGR